MTLPRTITYREKTLLFKSYFLKAHLNHHFIGAMLLSFLLGNFSMNGNAATTEKSDCLTQAATELEEVLCQIQIKNPSTTLPNLNEFRRNDSKMQYLLLKRPAKRLGIPLKKPKSVTRKNKAQAPTNTSREEHLDTIKMSRPISRSLSKTKENSKIPRVTDEKDKLGGVSLEKCQLREKSLTCPEANYRLVTNTPLNSIDQKLLTSDNQLRIEEAKTSQTDLRYNTRVYRKYIEKMLSIGLGYSTMSFTKFSYIYKDSVTQGENFAKRMFDMFELLKRERKTNSIKERYDNKIPESASWCMNLSDTLIVCDNKNQNWIYKRAY